MPVSRFPATPACLGKVSNIIISYSLQQHIFIVNKIEAWVPRKETENIWDIVTCQHGYAQCAQNECSTGMDRIHKRIQSSVHRMYIMNTFMVWTEYT